MADQLYFEDVNIGDMLPANVEVVHQAQMFFFSAATYNGHRIHYDRTWAVDVEGYPDILVHGPLQAALMAKTLTDWIGPAGRLVRIALQNRASAFPGEELRFIGTVTGKRHEDGQSLVDLDIHEEKGEGEILMPGSATVALPTRSQGE
jgi:hydroxyacyl-ACP dehydratase HTD2-like protein with hotdog domain